MMAGIRDILIYHSTPNTCRTSSVFWVMGPRLRGRGFCVQGSQTSLPDAVGSGVPVRCQEFIAGEPCALVLGDNIFCTRQWSGRDSAWRGREGRVRRGRERVRLLRGRIRRRARRGPVRRGRGRPCPSAGEACEAEVALRGDRPVLLRRSAWSSTRSPVEPSARGELENHRIVNRAVSLDAEHAERAYVGSWLCTAVGYRHGDVDSSFEAGTLRRNRERCGGLVGLADFSPIRGGQLL